MYINTTKLRSAFTHKHVIHTPTRAEAQALVSWLKKYTFCRCSLDWYDNYNKNMCYYLYDGEYSSINYYQQHNYTIIPFSSLLLPPILFTKVPTC